MSTQSKRFEDRITPWLPWMVFGICGVIRFFYLWSFWQSHPFAQILISDARIFDDWAMRIARGDWLGSPEVFVLPPLYPYALGVVYAVVEHLPKLVVVLQAICGCLSALLIYRLGARHFGVWAGFIAGVLFAGYGPQLYYEGMLLGNAGAVLLCLLGVTLIDNGEEKSKTRHWLQAGLVFGLAVLLRPNVLSAIPFVLFGLYWQKRWSRAVLVRVGLWFVGGLFLPLVLCGLRNGIVANDWVLMTAHGGINFYMGNHAGASGWFAEPVGMNAHITPDGVMGNLEGPKRMAEAELGRSLKASEVSDYWFGKGLDFWFEDPVGAIALALRKVRLFVSGYEVPLNYNFYYQRQYSGWLQIPLTELWFLFPLAISGMALTVRRFDRDAVLYLWILGYAVGVIAFHVSSRYRTPIVPFVMLFAGVGIWTIVDWVKTKQWKEACIVGAVLVVLWAGYRLELNGQIAQSNFGLDPFNLGTSYLWANENEKALKFLEEAESYKQGDSSLYYNLGLAYGRAGQSEKAKGAYLKTIELNSEQVSAYINLGNIYFREGAYREAVTSYRQALDRDPESLNARANMGWALFSMGQLRVARKVWMEVLRIAPGHPSARSGMQLLGP